MMTFFKFQWKFFLGWSMTEEDGNDCQLYTGTVVTGASLEFVLGQARQKEGV